MSAQWRRQTRMFNACHLRSAHTKSARKIGMQFHGKENETQRHAAGLATRHRSLLGRCAHTGPRVLRDGPSLATMIGTLLRYRSCMRIICRMTLRETSYVRRQKKEDLFFTPGVISYFFVHVLESLGVFGFWRHRRPCESST